MTFLQQQNGCPPSISALKLELNYDFDQEQKQKHRPPAQMPQE